jgi:chloramphenicol O-acetyltransferase type B
MFLNCRNQEVNVRPGYSRLVLAIRAIANSVRTWLYFHLRCSWVRRHGMIRIPWNVELWSPHKDIELGDRVQFGKGCFVHCDAKFGNNVLIARNVAFVGRDDHQYNIPGKTIWDSPRGDKFKVIVEDDVWIGHGCVILSGLTIGRGSVIAAGSVVTEDIPRYAIAGGNPSRLLGYRFSTEEIEQHEALLAYPSRTYAK